MRCVGCANEGNFLPAPLNFSLNRCGRHASLPLQGTRVSQQNELLAVRLDYKSILATPKTVRDE